MIRVIAAAFAVAALAGCAAYSGYGLEPGVASQAQVVDTMGRPAMTFELEGGARRLAYPRGPLGTETFMVDVGADGRLVAIRQVLQDDVFARIRPGDSRDNVLRLIGPPRADGLYRYVDSWGYLCDFSVDYDREGRVTSKFSRRLERDRRGP